jgi:protein-arginine kinase activator protein McsA
VEEEQAPKTPVEKPANPDVQAMREKMRQLIEAEKFEEAARIRDQIRQMEGR